MPGAPQLTRGSLQTLSLHSEIPVWHVLVGAAEGEGRVKVGIRIGQLVRDTSRVRPTGGKIEETWIEHYVC